MRLISIVTALLLIAIGAVAVTLVIYSASITRASAFLSQERLAAEQAEITKGRYENYFQIIVTLANQMADYD